MLSPYYLFSDILILIICVCKIKIKRLMYVDINS